VLPWDPIWVSGSAVYKRISDGGQNMSQRVASKSESERSALDVLDWGNVVDSIGSFRTAIYRVIT
jgi:hypothetical protein